MNLQTPLAPLRPAWLALPHAGLALLLACGGPAFATGSMLCEGPTRTVEIQVRLTADALLGLRVTHPDAPGADANSPGERFGLERQAVDRRHRRLNAAGRGLDHPDHRVTLQISGVRGTLVDGRVWHRLRCDWSVQG